MSTVTSEIPSVHVAGAQAPAARARIDSVDLLRGLVMVIMLLDHTRDFNSRVAFLFDPSNLERTTVALFLTRWITHFCAPVFVLLAGTGVFLRGARGTGKAELSRFLVTRGLWLMLLEFTLVRFVVVLNLDYAAFPGFMQVIFALGLGMVVLAALVHLPVRWVAAIGVAIVALHNLLDPVRVTPWAGPGSPAPGALQALWMVLHQQGFIVAFGRPVLVLYPVLPWIGVMAAGYALGAVYTWERERRRRFLLRLGAGLTAAFVALRLLDVYGDPNGWSVQKNAAFTVLSFLNTVKYPPSLLFLLMTLGPALMALAWFERPERGWLGRALVTFGRVPLFFYVLQWIAAHGLGIAAGLVAGQTIAHHFRDPFTNAANPPQGVGFSLGVVYLLWLLGVLLLYPLCRWFAGVRQRRKEWWLSYL
ncbi:MAG TPA: heparan-alpha-glucosaminide N-acetyltransferase domain-containing protein [Longimicrobium sp.]|jgi:uncharacterized membrane protein